MNIEMLLRENQSKIIILNHNPKKYTLRESNSASVFICLISQLGVTLKGKNLQEQIDLTHKPVNVASDQGLHCLLTRFSIKNRIKSTK